MTQVTGPLRDVLGNLLANTTCTILPKAELAGQDGGATALRKGIQVTTDGSGIFDADIQPGEHILTVHVPTLGTSYLSTEVVGEMAVPDDAGGVTLEYVLTTNVSEMTATILQQAIDAKDAAEAAQAAAEAIEGYRDVNTKSSSFTIAVSERADVFRVTASATASLPAAATAGNGHWFTLIADGADVTIDPDGAEQINGSATLTVTDGTSVDVFCDGTGWRTDLPIFNQGVATTDSPEFSNITRGGSQVYSRDNIVGTVSESGGVPTGAVIESGSNADGEYVRFADGTQMCWTTLTLTYDLSQRLVGDWTFPAEFSEFPALSASLRNEFLNGTSPPDEDELLGPWARQGNSPSKTECSVRLYRIKGGTNFSADNEATVYVQAIGLWFA